MAAAIVGAVACGGVLCCGAIVLGFILGQIRIYAERAAILDDLGWIDAVKQGWAVLKANLGPTIIIWLVFFVIGFALAMFIFAIFMTMFIPLIALITQLDPGPWIAATACCGGLFAVLVSGLLSAIIETYASATWTLTYRELTGKAQYAPAGEGTLGAPAAES